MEGPLMLISRKCKLFAVGAKVFPGSRGRSVVTGSALSPPFCARYTAQLLPSFSCSSRYSGRFGRILRPTGSWPCWSFRWPRSRWAEVSRGTGESGSWPAVPLGFCLFWLGLRLRVSRRVQQLGWPRARSLLHRRVRRGRFSRSARARHDSLTVNRCRMHRPVPNQVARRPRWLHQAHLTEGVLTLAVRRFKRQRMVDGAFMSPWRAF